MWGFNDLFIFQGKNGLRKIKSMFFSLDIAEGKLYRNDGYKDILYYICNALITESALLYRADQ